VGFNELISPDACKAELVVYYVQFLQALEYQYSRNINTSTAENKAKNKIVNIGSLRNKLHIITNHIVIYFLIASTYMNISRTKIIAYLSIFLISAIAVWLVNDILNENPCTNLSTNNQITSTVNKYEKFVDVPDIPPGEFKFGGSTTWAPIQKKIHPEIQSAIPDFIIKYTPPPANETPGSGAGIRMLLAGELDFSLSSRPLKDEEKEKGLIQKEVAIDGIAIAVNHKLNVQSLTLDQLRDIYTGRTTNWQELGGQNLKIRPYTRFPEDGGTPRYFINDVLNIEDEQWKPHCQLVINNTIGISKVAEDKGGIYYASIPWVIRQCGVKSLSLKDRSKGEAIFPHNSLQFNEYNECVNFKNRIKINSKAISSGRYPITRKLYVIINKNDSQKKKVGEAYGNLMLTQQGQKLLKEAGYASLDTAVNPTVSMECQDRNRK